MARISPGSVPFRAGALRLGASSDARERELPFRTSVVNTDARKPRGFERLGRCDQDKLGTCTRLPQE
jgi:hypothetical protein